MKTAIALGTFDGLHAGHIAVLEKIKDFFGIAVTFNTPPKSAFTSKPQLLILPQERVNRIKELGVKQVEMQSFDEVRNINAKDYLDLLVQKYNPQRIVCGFNYRFGCKAQGDVPLLEEFCKQNNIEFVCVPPVKVKGEVVSSTNIRNLIREGKMSQAAGQIYGGFGFTAPVLHGDARGRLLGFPTANQDYPEQLVDLKRGVYISCVIIDDIKYKSITNVGIRPTYRTDKVGCETYIKDFSGDIYGKEIKIQFLGFVREEQKFSSAQELKNAVLNDIKLLD